MRVTLLRSGVVAQLPKNIILNTEPERAVTISDLYFSLHAYCGGRSLLTHTHCSYMSTEEKLRSWSAILRNGFKALNSYKKEVSKLFLS